MRLFVRFLILITTFVFTTSTIAANIFSISPVISASKFIYPNQTGIAYYQVTNNTPMTLTNLGVYNLPNGVTQDTGTQGLTQGLITCRGVFDLAPSASCMLKLKVAANQMSSPIFSGPTICQNTTKPRPIYCSSPGSPVDVLNVTNLADIPSSAPELAISPSSLSLVTGGLQTITVTNTSSTETINNIVANFEGTALDGKVLTITPNPGGGNECLSVPPGGSCVLSLISYSQEPLISSTSFSIQGANSKSVAASASVAYEPPSVAYQTLLSSPLINADVWDNTPKIMSANYSFTGIVAVPDGESNVINAGGNWNIVSTSGAPYGAFTSAPQESTVAYILGYVVYYQSAIPVCFSQPVLSSTVNPTTFRVTLNTGEVVTPAVASLTPNFFYNQSSCIVIYGQFGNRLTPGELGAVYPKTVSIVEGSSNGTAIQLTLVGPSNVLTSMVGESIESINSYESNSGPSLLAAKISVMNAVGQNTQIAFSANVPNDGIAYYGAANAQYRLRMYTSGGFALGNYNPSPSRSMSLQPTDYNNVFRVQVGPSSAPIYLYESGVTYTIPGYGNIEVVGLASLQLAGTPINDAYIGSGSNYIDIILKGDLAAMRQITFVDIPAGGVNLATGTPYFKLFNPGGPGNNPTPGIIYTQPGPSVHQAVTQALDDANTVTYP